MKKSLPVLAVVAALTSHAFAQSSAPSSSSVSIYGSIDTAVQTVNNQGGKPDTYMSSGNLQGNRLGFTGNEDLGGGTSAVFVLETGFNSANGASSSSSSFFNRSAYVGLSDKSAGSLLLGRQYTPYYLYVGVISATTVISGATAAHPGDIDDLDVNLRNNNAVTYSTPVFSGAQLSMMYGIGGNPGDFSTGATTSVALRYANEGLKLALGYQKLDNGTGATYDSTSSSGGFIGGKGINGGYATSASTEMLAAGLRYAFGDSMIGLSATSVQYAAGAKSLFADTARFDSLGVFGTYNFTPALMAGGGYSYTSANEANQITDAAAYRQLSLGLTYSLSARTALYALGGWQKATGQTLNAKGEIIDAVASVGDNQQGTPSSGPEQSVVMLGIRHKF